MSRQMSFLKPAAKEFGVRVYKEIVQKDYFHFCIKITNRDLYRRFIRALTGVISQKLGKGLWILLPEEARGLIQQLSKAPTTPPFLHSQLKKKRIIFINSKKFPF